MGHQIEEHDTMLSVRETPWHKLGTVIPDYVSAQEAARLGGLTFEPPLLVHERAHCIARLPAQNQRCRRSVAR